MSLTTGSSSGTDDASGGCADAGAARVGVVDAVRLEALTVDGTRVGDGDDVCDGSFVVTDDQGVADVSVADDGRYCRLLRSTSITVFAGPVVEYHPADGADLAAQLRCPFVEIRSNGEVLQEEATQQAIIGSIDGRPVVSNVGAELLGIDLQAPDCTAFIEPGYRLTLVPSGPPEVTAFDPGALAPELVETLTDGGVPTLESGLPLVPGLAEAFEAGDATLAVAGDPADETIDDVVRLLVGRRVDLGGELAPAVNAPRLAPPSPVPTTDGEPPDSAETPPPTTAPADEPTTVDVPVFVDDDGALWTARIEAGTDALEQLQATLGEELRSGAYGRTFRQQTGRAPAYAELLPELLDGAEQC